jgi:hypothetical protein
MMTAADIKVLEPEPRSLPEGFESLSLPGVAVNSSEETSNETALVAAAA